MKKVCPNCGAETEGKFCPDCGTDLSAYEDKEPTTPNTGEQDQLEEVSDVINAESEGINDGTQATESKASVNASDDKQAEDGDQTADSVGTEIEVTTNESLDGEVETTKDKADKGKKKKIIIGGVIAALVLIVIAIFANQPKLVSISATYNGPKEKGTVITNSSDITVTGKYDNDTTENVTGWSVDETTIVPGYNDINVTYQDQFTSISVYSPLMSGGQYLASVDEIKDVLYSYNSKYVDGFSGFSKDPEVGGKYNYDGAVLDLSVSFTKKSGGENVDVDGDEKPNAVIVTMMLRSDDFGSNLDRILSAGAAAFTVLDPEINYDDAYSQIKTCTSDAVDNADGAVASDDKKLDNLNIGTGMFLANGNLLIFYSFQSK